MDHWQQAQLQSKRTQAQASGPEAGALAAEAAKSRKQLATI